MRRLRRARRKQRCPTRPRRPTHCRPPPPTLPCSSRRRWKRSRSATNHRRRTPPRNSPPRAVMSSAPTGRSSLLYLRSSSLSATVSQSGTRAIRLRSRPERMARERRGAQARGGVLQARPPFPAPQDLNLRFLIGEIEHLPPQISPLWHSSWLRPSGPAPDERRCRRLHEPWRMPLARLYLVEVAVEAAQRSRFDTYLLVGF